MTLEEIAVARENRKKELKKQEADQFSKDFQKLNELELEYGDGEVGFVKIKQWRPGLPTMLILRMPNLGQMRRYRDSLKLDKNGIPKNANQVGESLVRSCLLYPPVEELAEIDEARPSLMSSAIGKVIGMGGARESEGNDE